MSGNKRRKSGTTACIFVHAGAGYHSQQNENIHLTACNDAAKAAMALMQNGGSAVDAVEVAIKVLEDREITNAGYGSNLTVDGVVECDAVIVDHFGRSGAAGAVAQIKNPISLARLLLDHTAQTLTLKRVPPNLLVGQGAADFGHEHGLYIVPHDVLISPFAKERWGRWRADLIKAEHLKRRDGGFEPLSSPHPSNIDLTRFARDQNNEAEAARGIHTKAMAAATWNEGQPLSPPPSSHRTIEGGSPYHSHRNSSSSVAALASTGVLPDPPEGFIDSLGPLAYFHNHPASMFGQCSPPPPPTGGFPTPSRSSFSIGASVDEYDRNGSDYGAAILPPPPRVIAVVDGEGYHTTISTKPTTEQGPSITLPHRNRTKRRDEDVITDTVGAIAIDLAGNIACGASSGGIGMKHRGRIGPAALVGTGAAVIPLDKNDPEGMTVATVTSGTGEHMATTMAATVCNERVYHNMRKVGGGGYEECDDDEAIRGFISQDFMNHPSVKHSHSNGAIGMLTVKKTAHGIYLYFGHNTDSFALASMHSEESQPVCTMSRSKGNGVIAQGGRAVRYRSRKAA